MRLPAAIVVAMIPVAAAAQTDEWMRDDMSDTSLQLLRTTNLITVPTSAKLLPGSIGGPSQWVASQGKGPAYVVYFVPGRIHEVEVDTHRQTGASGDFSLAVSTDGKLYQPLDAGSVTLDSTAGWDYRLVSADQIPDNATHLLVQFPDGSTANTLSEVWIRFQWDDALASRFIPQPVPAQPAQSGLSSLSDSDLTALVQQLELSQPQQQVGPAASVPEDMASQTSNAGYVHIPQSDRSPAHDTSPMKNILPLTKIDTDPSDQEKEKALEDSREHPASVATSGTDGKPMIELHLGGTATASSDATPASGQSGKQSPAETEPKFVWVQPTVTSDTASVESTTSDVELASQSEKADTSNRLSDSKAKVAVELPKPESKRELGTLPVAQPDSKGSEDTTTVEVSSTARNIEKEKIESKPEITTAAEQTVPSPLPAVSQSPPDESEDAAPAKAADAAAEIRPLKDTPPAVEAPAPPHDTSTERMSLVFVRHGPHSKTHALFQSRNR